MTKVRWHKRSQRQEIANRSQNNVSFSCLESSQYQSFLHENLQLYVSESAIHKLTTHLSEDTSKETGGILVGNVSNTSNIHNTVITGAIAAPTTIGNCSTFRFTPHCWPAILKEQEESYPQTQIVGWYHSHPNFGVFLSGVDLKTQEDCFNQPWHIAVVYDPIRDEIGFFCGSKGQPMSSCKTLEPQAKASESETLKPDQNKPSLSEDNPVVKQTNENTSHNTSKESSLHDRLGCCLSILKITFFLFYKN
ncbi:Mov34/MPN/PAD-1 family protein [Roseofilum sp. BLCC_M154]|uniref:Mov34/MPN/PAD-1 family protein n=1 Tax=Roseofilum acuticapitatum BLCC-M154 TaxID=3022444 RepID=A0ABT7ASE4_9CYAN|nr:Mov34/MPN/PAD-1 family protein [Roseofilum acuticapitatum]MDJ1169828.1 Mov34/MPN/PAD-1 family protein [Roseofilum acuticapitatum BLCC-M154]